ncbi:hypothetical protein L208DRAFT_1386884, partial [Tricholoma matsutake]
ICPILALVHFGDPDWYRQHVVPYRNKLFPPERTNQIPRSQSGVREELNRIKEERLAKRAAQHEELQ